MVDPAKALPRRDTSVNLPSVLQDAFISVSYRRHVNVDIGRFKLPLSLEGLQSSASLDTERALFSSDRARGGAYGDVRDIGVMAYGPLSGRLDYQIGLFNGTGSGKEDWATNQKAIAARLVYRPMVLPGLQIGTSRVWGIGGADPRMRRERMGAELLYVNGPLTLKTEYMTGTDGTRERQGYYAHFACKLNSKWDAILRYDVWDPDRDLETTPASVTERDYIAGFNYVIDRHMKLQFNYVRKTYEDEIVYPVNLGVLRLQALW
jgi:phosphate-selective porin